MRRWATFSTITRAEQTDLRDNDRSVAQSCPRGHRSPRPRHRTGASTDPLAFARRHATYHR